MKIKKPSFWDKNYLTFFSIILWPLSFIYKFLLLIRKSTSNEKQFSKPIICIGNIYIGGTGKTPISIKIFEIFKKEKNPVVIRKKYDDQIDEVEIIKKYARVIIDSNRSVGIQKAIDKNYDLIILDDGFQDLSIKKNLNIICFNSRQKIGNGLVIPSGPLRESLSALKESKIVLINGKKDIEFEQKLKKYNHKLKFFYFKYELKNINEFKNKKLICFAGIGNPENFFYILRENRLNIVREIKFPDHYKFTQKDFEYLIELEKKYNGKLVTTEKDFYRISPFERKRFGMIPIKLKIEKEEVFIKFLKECI